MPKKGKKRSSRPLFGGNGSSSRYGRVQFRRETPTPVQRRGRKPVKFANKSEA